MTETELDILENAAPPRRLHFDWMLPLFFKPRQTLDKVVHAENAVWFTPLLVLSLLAIFAVVIAGPLRATAAQNSTTLPPDFQYFTPEQQQQYMQAQESAQGTLATTVFPAVGQIAGIWLSWLILGLLLHLGLTLAGSRSSTTAMLNLTAWASLPFGLRFIAQGIYFLTTQHLIQKPGLSGFIPLDANGFVAFLGAVLALVDLWLVWQVILLLVGARLMSGFSRAKAWSVSLAIILIALVLAALPGFISASLSGVSTIRPFFF